MKYWLLKSEPFKYSWDDFLKDGKTYWDGVRNYQARNNMKDMKVGDQALFYHSVNGKSVIGIAEVVKEHYPDPTTDDERWVVVDLVPLRKLSNKVPLNQIKADGRLSNMVLVKNTRLSVQPVRKEELDLIVTMGDQ